MKNNYGLKSSPKIISMQLGVDYLKLYYALKQKFDATYMFESDSTDDNTMLKQHYRYYTIGFDPLCIFSARGKKFTITDEKGTEELEVDNPYEILKDYFPSIPGAGSYQGGLIGYFSYEAAKYFESSLNYLDEHPDFPLFELGLYVDGLVYDKETEELTYYTFHENRSGAIQNIIDSLEDIELPESLKLIEDEGLSINKNQYKEIFEYTHDQIKKGNSFQVEVGLRNNYKIEGDKFAVYNRLRTTSPAPYMYYMHFGEREIFGASPELVVSLSGERVLTTPCAGSEGRNHDNPSKDKELTRKLVNNIKEKAEHAMLVDLHRNDISKVCKPGSVHVTNYMNVIKLKHVQHISSDIEGIIEPDKDSFDLLKSIMPCGVLTGAPKLETMKIINHNENEIVNQGPRGPYGGAVGRFSFNGDCAFAMPIRGLFCSADNCYSQACGGVVFDSIRDKEYEEIMNKLKGVNLAIKELQNA